MDRRHIGRDAGLLSSPFRRSLAWSPAVSHEFRRYLFRRLTNGARCQHCIILTKGAGISLMNAILSTLISRLMLNTCDPKLQVIMSSYVSLDLSEPGASDVDFAPFASEA
ncbi:hypothetical protein CERSUDRAFT_114425 [Gelatoporia subvermispora B]|uniref:Uncharacterized protein n=1 Tax=Ceriporiopsis subvermispora (strain B) TaxID=914234 RepID=M2PMW5_CERS8|nr:hypothetical protein CERSUDRAFT_114425 [Gelatoporia subvermispora B]